MEEEKEYKKAEEIVEQLTQIQDYLDNNPKVYEFVCEIVLEPDFKIFT